MVTAKEKKLQHKITKTVEKNDKNTIMYYMHYIWREEHDIFNSITT